MIFTIICTAVIWCLFFAFMNREPSRDYAPNIIPLLQAGVALIVTLLLWLIYFMAV